MNYLIKTQLNNFTPQNCSDFPGLRPNQQPITFTMNDVLHSAVTFGQRNTRFLRRYNIDDGSQCTYALPHWLHGLINHHPIHFFNSAAMHKTCIRRSMVLHNINFLQANSPLKHTYDFDRMDRTEKMVASYYIGMTFCKLAAKELLEVPWLFDISWAEEEWDDFVIDGSYKSKRRPDFIGVRPHKSTKVADDDYVVLEAKGRSGNGGIRKTVNGALKQLDINCQINGKPPNLKAASVLYPDNIGDFNLIWEAPTTTQNQQNQPFSPATLKKLSINSTSWLNYYHHPYRLFQIASEMGKTFSELMGFDIKLSKQAQSLYENASSYTIVKMIASRDNIRKIHGHDDIISHLYKYLPTFFERMPFSTYTEFEKEHIERLKEKFNESLQALYTYASEEKSDGITITLTDEYRRKYYEQTSE